MTSLTVTLVDGQQPTWTADGDGYTGYQVHPSGALMVYTGVDEPASTVLAFGTWLQARTG